MKGWRVFWGWVLPFLTFLFFYMVAATVDAYSISGTVTNGSGKTGRIYIGVYQEGGGDTGLGVSIQAPGPFAIRGVPDGSYLLKAFLDSTGTGTQKGNDPAGVSAGTIVVAGADYSGPNAAVSLADPAAVAPVTPADFKVIPGDNVVMVSWKAPEDPAAGLEIADYYTVYWSDQPDPYNTVQNSQDVPAGSDSFLLLHLPNGNAYYFTVTAWANGAESAPATEIGPVTVNPAGGGSTVSGNIISTGLGKGPLYVAVSDDSGASYLSWAADAPADSQPFTVYGVPAGTYRVHAVMDMNNNGFIDPGDISTSEQQAPVVTVVAGNVSADITLTAANAAAAVATSHWKEGFAEGYHLIFDAWRMKERPVNVAVITGPAGITYPIDIGSSSRGGFSARLNAPARPQGPPQPDSYTLSVSYANPAVPADELQVAVTGVIDSFATPTAPVGYVPYPIASPATFAWDAPPATPVPPSPYTYTFWLDVPGFKGDTYANLSSGTNSANYDHAFADATQYLWSIAVKDQNGNRAESRVSFMPTSAPVVSNFTPTSGEPWTVVTITGFNFDPTLVNNEVKFNGALANMTSVNPAGTQLVVAVPASATSGLITVAAKGKSGPGSTSSKDFTVIHKTSTEVTSDFTWSTYAYGTPLAFTAKVLTAEEPFFDVPTGEVQFMVDGADHGLPVPVVAGTATLITSTVPVGSHSVAVRYLGTPAYKPSSSTGIITLQVVKAMLTVRADDKSKVYGAPNPTFTASYTGLVNGETAAVLGGTLTFTTPATAGSPVGGYPITPSGQTSPNYSITFADGTLTVTKAPLKVKADDKTKVYGEPLPTFTASYTGFVNGDTEAKLGGTLAFTTPATAESPVAAYPITPAGLTAANYDITFADGALSVTKAQAAVILGNLAHAYDGTPKEATATSDPPSLNVSFTYNGAATPPVNAGSYAVEATIVEQNYQGSAGGTLVIAKAVAIITLDIPAASYDGTPKAVTAVTTPPGLTGVAITYGGSATAPTNAGSYAVAATLTHDNYQASEATGTLTITPASLTVRADDKNKVYGAPNPTFTASYTGLVNGETAAVLGGTLTFTTPATEGSPVGGYPITPSGLTSPNYSIIFADGTLTVTKAPLTVTADDKSRIYGAENPPLTYAIAGFTHGETLATSGVTGDPLLSTTAAQGSPAGSYPITLALGTLVAANYDFVLVNGTLTVNKAIPAIIWNNPADLDPGRALDTPQLNATASVPGNFSYNSGFGTVLPAGSHTLTTTFTPADAVNYGAAAATVQIYVLDYGDLNGDHRVGIDDAIRALRLAVGIESPTATDLARGDIAPLINHQHQPDGRIDVMDVIMILRKAVGLPL